MLFILGAKVFKSIHVANSFYGVLFAGRWRRRNTCEEWKNKHSLLDASKELKCNELLVITNENESIEYFEGKKIKFIPLWKWLLG